MQHRISLDDCIGKLQPRSDTIAAWRGPQAVLARLIFRGTTVREYRSIQYLRGLAATLVVIFHVGAPLQRLGVATAWPNGLSGGVDIFFIISGFVMWMTTRARPIGPLAFWWKRFVRIAPLYWVVTSVMLAILLIAPTLLRTSVFNLHHVIASYAFFPVENPGKPAMEPLLFPGWTLEYEMFFYLIFGLFLLTQPRMRLWGTVAVLVTLVVLGWVLAPPRLSVAGFYTADIILEFGYGLLLGAATFHFGEDRLAPPALGIALFLLGTVLLVLMPDSTLPRGFTYGLPALAVVVGLVAVEGSRGLPDLKLAHALGNASYSIYLSQLISMAAFLTVWRVLHLDRLPAAPLLFTIGDVLAALIAGWLCYRLVERPLTRLVGGSLRRRMPETIAAPTD